MATAEAEEQADEWLRALLQTERERRRCRHPSACGIWIDEAKSISNRGPLVQTDAHRTDVALARPLRVPDMRPAAKGVLGRSLVCLAVREGIAERNECTRRIGKRRGIEGSMLVTTALAVIVLLSLVLSMVRCPGTARTH